MTLDAHALAELLVIALATARLTALITLDEISKPLRDLIWHYFPPEDDEKIGAYYQSLHPATEQERARLATFKNRLHWWQRRFEFDATRTRQPTFLGKLIACHRCTGVWVAFATSISYLISPSASIVIALPFALAFVSTALIGRYWK